ncbi:MAG: S8 family serine peptidase [Steroidobacteraceae bacterium]
MPHDRTRIPALVALAAALVVQPGAHAQVTLPGVPKIAVPILPALDVPATLSDLGRRVAADARRLRIRDLLRRHPRALDRDPAGELIVRGEILAFSPSDSSLARLRDAGFSVLREEVLEVGARIVALSAPGSARHALARVRKADPAGRYDYNHIYLDGGTLGAALTNSTAAPALAARSAASLSPAPAIATHVPPRIGLIDTGVDSALPVFAHAAIEQSGCDAPVPAPHGTAVASLIADAYPAATIVAADVFCRLPTGGASDRIAAALDRMAREHVAVVNASLVGPRNLVVEGVTRLLVTRGVLIVAAVGNDGPAALPLFPAAYPGVVGVTAVDAGNKVLPEACRGDQVDFAARGADLEAVGGAGGRVPVRGTSFAAPLVTARLAALLHEPDPAAAAAAVTSLAHEATDLGRKGRDIIYGDGYVAPLVDLAGRK